MKDGEEIPREPENSSASSVSGTEATPGNPVQPGPPSGEAVDHTPLTAAHQIERTATSSEADVKSEPAAGSETKSPESSNADEQKASAAEKNFLLRLADNLKALFTALSSAFLFLLLLALIVSLGMELARSTVFLDLSEVPKDLRDNGLSTIGISQQLADELVEIQRISLSKNTRFLLDPTWPQPDIQVPGSSISFHSVSQWLKQRLANPIANNDIHLTGEFTKDKDDYRLTIRRIDEHVNRNYSVTVQNRSISKALKLGAEAVAKLADPVTLATYYFYIEDRNDGYQKTIETIKYVIGWGDDQTRARAYNLWGNVLVDQGDAK